MLKYLFDLEKDRLQESRVFRDPIHNYVHVDYSIFWKLINSKEMQRLRRIKQLGGACHVYHGAEHSRFNHSLGVYEVARQMCENPYLKKELNDYDKMTALCAALLHDLGHGPYSHAFERVFGINHEAYTIKMILEDTEVHSILKSYHEELPQDVASVIEKTHPNKILIQMVTSQLDADRMDFLLRDSYYTGTTYGHFDLNRVLRTMRVYDNQLVFKESGAQAIENYILARYHMYWQVYYHPVSRSHEQLLYTIFLRIKDLYKQNFEFGVDLGYLKPFLMDKEVTVEEYFHLDESILHYYFTLLSEGKDKVLSDLCLRFIHRHLFKYVDLKDKKMMDDYQNKAKEKGFDPRYYIFSDDQSQVPYHYHGMSDLVNEILILKEEKLYPLPEVSEVVYAIVNSSRSKSDAKLYYPLEINLS